jgi:DNA-binding GntR family transcriptional regulator
MASVFCLIGQLVCSHLKATRHDHLQNHRTAVRLQLEPLAAELAAATASPSSIAAMRQNIAAFKDAASPEELAALDVQFHELLCTAAEQPWLSAALPGIIYSLLSLTAFGWLVWRR